MDTRLFPRRIRGPIRQAHPRSRHHRLADSVALLLGVVLLAALTIGTVVGGGAGEPVPAHGVAVKPWPATGPTEAGPTSLPAPTVAPVATVAPVTLPLVVPVESATAPPLRVRAAAPAPTITGTSEEIAAALAVPRPVAAFLGDSYTTGWAGAGIGARGWPAIVSAAHGWRIVNRAVAGTGFVNPGWTGQPIGTRVSAVLRARPGIVFVAGGHNDNRFGARATGRAAEAVLQRLRRELPDAVIVVFGPIWGNGSPPASVRGIRTELRRSAAAIDAIFVDPIRDGWFAGAAGRLILADGIHPSNGGHRRIASRVQAALQGTR